MLIFLKSFQNVHILSAVQDINIIDILLVQYA
jgi:hypothetical protein